MNELEWMESEDWLALFSYSWETDLLTVRKLRLFAAAACRRFSHRLLDSHSWRAVEVCERCADGGVDTDDEMIEARDNAVGVAHSLSGVFRAAANSVCPLAYSDAGKVGRATENAPYVHAYEAVIAAGLIPPERTLDYEDELRQHPIFLGGVATGERIQADLLREVLGNPFRPVTLNPAVLAWNDATVVRLARAAYDERHLPSGELDLHRIAVLADALEEAGGPAELAAHLRSSGPHVRGCFAVDLCLGLS